MLSDAPERAETRRAGVTTMLVTDHPHLFEVGGENYHCDFTAWDYLRGHEGDPWRTRPDPSWALVMATGEERPVAIGSRARLATKAREWNPPLPWLGGAPFGLSA